MNCAHCAEQVIARWTIILSILKHFQATDQQCWAQLYFENRFFDLKMLFYFGILENTFEKFFVKIFSQLF